MRSCQLLQAAYPLAKGNKKSGCIIADTAALC